MKIIFSKLCFFDDDMLERNLQNLIENIKSRFGFPSSIDEKILVYFGWKSQFLLRAFGNTYFQNIPDHKAKIDDEFREVLNDDKVKNCEYFVYLATEIYTDNDELFKLLTIAHELQHVEQYRNNRCYFLLGRVLFFYLFMKRMNGAHFKRLPYEYDARRRAKALGIEMFGKSRVDAFLKERTSFGDEYDRAEYDFLDKINVEDTYELLKDYDIWWNKYKSHAKSELDRINKKRRSDLTEEEKLLKNAYDYFVKECPSMSE